MQPARFKLHAVECTCNPVKRPKSFIKKPVFEEFCYQEAYYREICYQEVVYKEAYHKEAYQKEAL